jgi:integrase
MKRRIFPKNVTEFVDRHGKRRTRYRVSGQPTRYFKASPGNSEWLAELESFRQGVEIEVNADRIAPGSINDLVTRYLVSTSFRNGGDATQLKNRGILDGFRTVHGERLVREATFEKIDKILADKSATHPAAARNLRKQLRRLFEYAVRIKMRADNPAEGIRLPVQRAGLDGETGYHTWSEDEIAQFQAYHALGTRPRLAMELMLWTGVRKSDLIRMGRQHVKAGRITIGATKTGKILSINVAPQLKAAIDASPSTNMTFLVTAYGKPFTPNGFGNWFRDRCNEAGLPQCSAHGLRKAIARRMADNGEGNQGIKSVTLHSGDSEVALYTRGVEQSTLADKVIGRLSAAHLANLGDPNWLTPQETAEERG